MTQTPQPHVVELTCPLTCIERQVPAKAYEAIRRHLLAERIFHPAVHHVVTLHQESGLNGIRRLGTQGRELTTAFLESAGLVPPRLDHAERQDRLELLRRLAS